MLPTALVMDVYTSWERVKRIPNYEEVASELIFTKLFEIAPMTRKIFQFGKCHDNHDLKTNRIFQIHAKALIGMITAAVNLLDPLDTVPLQYELIQLGKRHIKYGITKEYLPPVAIAVDYALTVALGESEYVGTELRAHWLATLNFIAEQMTIGMETAQEQMIIDVTSSGNILHQSEQRPTIVPPMKDSSCPPSHSVTSSSPNMYQHIASVLLYTRLVKLVPPEDIESDYSFYKNDNDTSCFKNNDNVENNPAITSSDNSDNNLSQKDHDKFHINTNLSLVSLNKHTKKSMRNKTTTIIQNNNEIKSSSKHQTKVYQECSKSMICAIDAAITILSNNPTDIDSVSNMFIALGEQYAMKYHMDPKSLHNFIASLEYMMIAILKSSILDRPSSSSHHDNAATNRRRHYHTQLQESWRYFIGFVMSKMTIGIKQY